MALISRYIVLGCWIIFVAYWLISGWRVKATSERQSMRSSLAHRIPLGVSFLLLAAWNEETGGGGAIIAIGTITIMHLPEPMNIRVTSHADWALVMGGFICLVGLFVTLWARWTLAGNWSSDVTFRQGHELIRRGPYRFVRHPIYTGLLTMCLGTAIEIGRLRSWLALPLMMAALLIKLKQEEAFLLRHFPDEYQPYRKQVKAIIPFVI
ncbi:MAG: isoprenylcysteine carboxylmethyltransferase family protein [Acidobacteria bacterium]|nr:isoprenylcysteine carboxylmethyltransferase family protein [Acidobacteriota bacterium]